MKSRAIRIILGVVIALAIPIVVVLALTWSFGRSDRISKGVTISGVGVGEMTRPQAEDAVRKWAQDRLSRRITLTALDSRWHGTGRDFGARADVKKAVDTAFAVGRRGAIVNRVICALTSAGKGKHFLTPIELDERDVSRTLDKIARSVDRPHRDAQMRIDDLRLEIRHESCGIKVNKQRALALLCRSLPTGAAVVSLPVEVDRPDVTSEDAAKISTLLSRFTTYFNAGKRDRTHNLRLAATALNGTVIKPGQDFSYNSVVGPRVLKRGFRNAPIFVRGQLEPGIGGGICQVSSTLYNTVLLAGLKPLERHRHSRTVPYVIPGRDATVAYGVRDFRFENINSSPICILTDVKGCRLTIDIYGAADDRKIVKVFTSRPRYSGVAGRKTVIDPTLPPGTRKITDKGARGVSAVVYRTITNADGEAVTGVVSRDRYPGQAVVVAVGPKVKTEIVAEPAVSRTDTPIVDNTKVKSD